MPKMKSQSGAAKRFRTTAGGIKRAQPNRQLSRLDNTRTGTGGRKNASFVPCGSSGSMLQPA